MRKLLAILGLALALTWAAPLGAQTGLALVVPQKGPLAPFGQEAERGAGLALKTWGGGFQLQTVDEGEGSGLVAKAPIVAGYFTESALVRDAPGFIRAKKAVLLPYLTTARAAALGPDCFFRLMATGAEQGAYLARQALALKRRPRRLLVLTGPDEVSQELTASFLGTLRNSKLPKPLDKNAKVVSLATADDLDASPEFAKAGPDLVILAADMAEALKVAPRLAAHKAWAKTPVWGGAAMGFREAGAAFTALGLNLSLALPINLADRSKAVAEFRGAYISEYKTRPTWLAALAYDSLNLAIKAASSGEGDLPAFLDGHSHHALAAYELAAGGGGQMPLGLMAVTMDTLGYLP